MTQSTSANIRCTAVPSGSSWYPAIQPASIAPVALDYKWVRVTLKANNSNTAVPVNGNSSNANVVCWNGTSEVTAASTSASACNSLIPIANPVYLVTALAVTPSGARRVVQEEIAQTPKGGLPGGLFATGMGCSALESCRQCQHRQLQLRHRGYSHESAQQSNKLGRKCGIER